MEIKVKRSSVVKPWEDTPKHRLWISNLDCVAANHFMPTVHSYKPTSGTVVDGRVLIEALSKALVLFYPLAGRLATDENNRREINCNGEGVLFVEAETDASLTDFGDPKKLSQLIPTVDLSSSYDVTFFKCGGVSLGIVNHHTVVDGTSAFHFINTWSEISRGLPVSVLPFIDRTLLRSRDPPNPTFHHIEYDPPPTMLTNSKASEYIPCTVTFNLTLDQINMLKSKANYKDEKLTRYTSFEILTAHIWRCMCKACGLSDDQPSKLYMPVDGRSRMCPPLPPGYFGNAIFVATQISLSGDILSNPLSHTVEKIHLALKRMDDEYLRSALDFIELHPDLTAMPRTFRSPNLKIVSWARFPMHEADFGWGKPIFMGRSSVSEGAPCIQPSPSNDGSLSFTISLEPSHMELFKKLFYDFVTSKI